MDHNFTERVQAWLATPSAKRDYALGAQYMLQLSGNQILFNNVMRNPRANAEVIEYNLNKYIPFRLANLTHEQVVEMDRQVKDIAKRDNLTSKPAPAKSEAEEIRRGKRADHDSLPEDIQSCYVQNLSILQKMRNLHTRLTLLSSVDSPCPDGDRYPFLKELIALDKQYHANWAKYDDYQPDAE